jgi:ribonuclease P protein component
MLPKKHRFTSGDFKRLKGAKSVHTPHLLVRYVLGKTATAAVVSSSVAKTAVSRNRLRRRIYSIFARTKSPPPGVSVVVIAKQGAVGIPFRALKKELVDTLQKIPNMG